MRVIKFRGKDKHTGKWVFGDLAHSKGISTNGLYDRVMVGGYHVIEETVGQFTGLLDKNSKEIYEGDVALVTKERSDYYPAQWDTPEHKETKRWNEYYACEIGMFPEVRLNGSELIIARDCKHIEVIGSVHDNPELLKGDER